jgi:hypothetical protein
VACVGLNLFYQFFLHTELVRRLGPLEWVLNTPSHHRVHHGRNPQYLDANYAGVFVIWDRFFGSFRPEQDAADYGTVEPFRSFNPVWANFAYFSVLRHKSRACRGWSKLLAWFRPPEWRPAHMTAYPSAPQARQPTRARLLYGALVMAEALVITVAVLLWKERLSWPMKLGAIAMVVGTLTVAGGLLDDRPWAVSLEVVRRIGLGLVCGVVTMGGINR